MEQVNQLAELVHKNFRGRKDAFAVESPTWRPIKQQPSWPLIKPHFEGKRAYGFYVLDTDGQCYCSCCDIDHHGKNDNWKKQAEDVHQLLLDSNVEPLVEISQSGQGCHLWLFHPDGARAETVRAFWGHILNKAGLSLSSTEVFPRQTQLKHKQLGNLIRYPLWNKSHFVDPLDDWSTITPSKALSGPVSTCEDRLDALIPKGRKALRSQPGEPEVALTEAGLTGKLEQLFQDKTLKVTQRWNGSTKELDDKTPSSIFHSFLVYLIQTGFGDWEIGVAAEAWCKKWSRPNLIERLDIEIARARDFVTYNTVEKKRRVEEIKTPGALVRSKTPLDQVEERNLEWIWNQRIPLGQITLLFGMSGSYKTWFAMEVAAYCTNEGSWPDGLQAPQGECWIFTSEDTASTIRKRASILGADLSKMHLFDTSEHPADLNSIAEALEFDDANNVNLVIVDPGDGHIGERNTNDAIEVREQLTNLKPILEEKNIACLIIHHRNKRSAEEGQGQNTVAGSRAWVNVPRTVISFRKDPESKVEPKITLEWIKHNASEIPPTSMVGLFKNGFSWICEDKEGWDVE